MTIAESWAKPIAQSAAKAFVHPYNPDKPSLQVIFHNHWDDFCDWIEDHPEIVLRQVVYDEVDKLMACGTVDMGFEIYECPNCHRHHIICYTCKSRFCPSCGVKMTRQRALQISESTLDVNHRHIIFTIDDRLRPYFKVHRDWLDFLFDAAWDTLTYAFEKIGKKSEHLTPGAIMTLHTFGRPINWNPHMHCLVTEGGMTDGGCYKHTPYIHYDTLRKSFMKQLLDKMRDAMVKGSDEYRKFMRLRNQIYQDDQNGFYVNAPAADIKGNGKKQVVQYIIRYAGRPAMAQSRITSYDYETKQITYWYEDHKTGDTVTVTEHVYAFFLKLIQHIPEREFKMVRYYGIYATCEHRHKKVVKLRLRKQRSFFHRAKNRPRHYRRSLVDTFGVDPLLCTCGCYMEFVDSCVPSRFRYDDESP